MRNNFIFSCFFIMLFLSCGESSKEPNLEKGLEKYRKVRLIDELLIDGFIIKKWAFKKTDSLHYQFIFQLNDGISSDTIEKYGFGLVYFADKKYLPENKDYLIVQSKPTLTTKGDFKYIIETVVPPVTTLDSLHIFLTGREEYTGVIGNMVKLKNIEL